MIANTFKSLRWRKESVELWERSWLGEEFEYFNSKDYCNNNGVSGLISQRPPLPASNLPPRLCHPQLRRRTLTGSLCSLCQQIPCTVSSESVSSHPAGGSPAGWGRGALEGCGGGEGRGGAIVKPEAELTKELGVLRGSPWRPEDLLPSPAFLLAAVRALSGCGAAEAQVRCFAAVTPGPGGRGMVLTLETSIPCAALAAQAAELCNP